MRGRENNPAKAVWPKQSDSNKVWRVLNNVKIHGIKGTATLHENGLNLSFSTGFETSVVLPSSVDAATIALYRIYVLLGIYKKMYVCTGTADNATFDTAIKAMKDSGKLSVVSGTYTFSDSVIVTGKSIVIESAGTFAASESVPHIFNFVRCPNVYVQGLTTSDSGFNYALRFYRCGSVYCRDSTISNVARNGVFAQYCGSVELYNVEITGCGQDGLNVSYSPLRAELCDFNSNDDSGVVFSGTTASISRSNINSNGAHGFEESATDIGCSFAFADVDFNSNGAAGCYCRGNGFVTAHGCNFNSNGTNGLEVDGGLFVTNCGADNNTSNGIRGDGVVVETDATGNGGNGFVGSLIINGSSAIGGSTSGAVVDFTNAYTGSQVVVTGVNFGSETTSTKTITVDNGIVTDIT